jgi:hypothetical protein
MSVTIAATPPFRDLLRKLVDIAGPRAASGEAPADLDPELHDLLGRLTTVASQVAPPLITDAQFCGLLHITESTSLRWRRDGTGPDYVKANGRILYATSAVAAWVAAKTVAA